jgi:hypothetical protein
MTQQTERMAAARQIVFDTTHDKRRAVTCRAVDQLIAREPYRADNPMIEHALRIVTRYGAGKGETNVRRVACRVMIVIDTDERTGPEMVRGFLECFADCGVSQRFTRIEMPGRLIETKAFIRFFFDHEKTPVALGDGGDRDVRSPDEVIGSHRAILAPR